MYATRCYLVILVIVMFQTLANCNLIGQSCYHEKKKTNGICKILQSCQSARHDINVAGVYPQNCGSHDTYAVVCCPLTSGRLQPVGEKAKQACTRYEELGYKLERPPILLKDAPLVKTPMCPWDSQASPVIIQGKKPIRGEFPHMALIGYRGSNNNNYEWNCGGSLISDKFVLTAAHCSFEDLYPHVVRLGDLNYTDPNDDRYVQQIKIKTIHKHPDYNDKHHYNDIALLELEKPARLSVYVKPACLQVNKFNYPAGIITGWGYTEYGTPSEHLLKANVQRFTPQICNKTYMNEMRTLPRGIDENQQICYGSSESKEDTCQGDSGGPIQVYATGIYCSYYVFGVTSFGKGCGHKALPGVYVRLSYYMEWIEDLVWP